MNNTTALVAEQSKERKYLAQYQIVRNYLFSNTASRYMASVDTGIPLQNVCRYVAKMRDLDQVAIQRKDFCRISGEFVEFLTTNPELFPPDNQLELFDQ